VRGIEGGLGWYDAYIAGRQNTTAFGLLLPWWIEWTPLVFAELTMVKVAAAVEYTPHYKRAAWLVGPPLLLQLPLPERENDAR
jgi:hypothetical protein